MLSMCTADHMHLLTADHLHGEKVGRLTAESPDHAGQSLFQAWLIRGGCVKGCLNRLSLFIHRRIAHDQRLYNSDESPVL